MTKPNPNGKYQVRVAAFGRRFSGGYFASLADADRAAVEMRRRLHAPLEQTEG